MYCVIFEVRPEPARLDTYLDLAARLKPEVEAIEGFLSVERFTSRGRPGWVLSFQFWADEGAIARWRQHKLHRKMQQRGRQGLFLDYRLRVGPVIEEAGAQLGDRPRLVLALEADADAIAPAPALAEQDVFDSLYNPGRSLLLGACARPEAAFAWGKRALAAGQSGAPCRVSVVAIARDYGMHARSEAPPWMEDGADRGRMV